MSGGVFNRAGRIVAIALVAIALAGCGKKGPPTPPPGVPVTYPQNYPASQDHPAQQPSKN